MMKIVVAMEENSSSYGGK